MKRRIVDFHQDDEKHRAADLECLDCDRAGGS